MMILSYQPKADFKHWIMAHRNESDFQEYEDWLAAQELERGKDFIMSKINGIIMFREEEIRTSFLFRWGGENASN